MSDTDTIRVTALDRTLEFGDRDELADHVREILDNRGGIYDPLEVAAIQRLAALANGGAPDRVHRIARKATFHAAETDADAERRATPFGDRIEELEAELADLEGEHEEAREALFERRDRIGAAQRRGETDEVARLRRDLPELVEDERVADRAARRARAALHAAEKAADRWRADRAARFVIGEAGDRRVVDREGLADYLDNMRR